MYQDSNKPSVHRIASPVVACYYNYDESCILTGYVGCSKENETKKVIIESANFCRNALPDVVSQEVKKYGFSIWINKSESLKKSLGLRCNEIEFDITNEMEIQELQGLFQGLMDHKRIVITADAVLSNTESCTNATKILLRGLSDSLWGHPPGRAIAGGTKFQNPFGSPSIQSIRF